MAQRESNTKNICLEIIRGADRPLTTMEVAELAIKAGASQQIQSISPSINQWYKLANNGWQFVQREVAPGTKPGGKSWLWFFDGGKERSPVPREEPAPDSIPRTKSASKEIERAKRVEKLAKDNDLVLAKVVFDEDGFIVLVTSDRRVIQGRYLH